MLRPNPNKPVGPPNGTLPCSLAVFAYLRVLASDPDSAFLTLKIHNGTNDRNASFLDNWIKDYFFDQFAILLPNGWELDAKYPDPNFGATGIQGGLLSGTAKDGDLSCPRHGLRLW